MDLAGGDGKAFDAIELYSCFPCVPKMARRTLGLGPDVQPTVTGGLTFFGAPLNTYMTHAACAMVRKLRGGAKLGLLYGQGGFVTKHHALVLSRQAPHEALAQDTSVQAEADRNRGAVPEFVTEASGKGTVESFTVIYGRNGEVEHGVVMLRTRRQCPRAGAGARRRPRDAGASAEHGPHAGGVARRDQHRRTTACWSGGWGDALLLPRPARGAERLARRCSAVRTMTRVRAHPRFARRECTTSAPASGARLRDAPYPFTSCFSDTFAGLRPWRRRRRGPGRRRRCRRAARR